MKNLIFIILMCLFSCSNENESLLKVGDFQFHEVAYLPSVLIESSGLEVAGESKFWSFNDRNGNTELYQFDTIGNLYQVVELTDANNIDWEDITQDEGGNLYIGDFGNNDNDRQDLTIDKIANEDLNVNNNSVSVTQIKFAYPQQTAYPPPESEHFFDVESMFSKGEFLYLLTRDRSKPFVGKTTLYRLPNTEGEYEAELLSEFFTDSNIGKGQITAADLSPNDSILVMISNQTLWLFQNISGENYFDGEFLKLDFPIKVDMEGVVFQDDCTIYLCNEEKSGEPAILYRIILY